MTTDPIPSLHKLLTASELGQSVHLDAQEVEELSAAIIAARMTQLALWNEHQYMAAQIEAPLAVKH